MKGTTKKPGNSIFSVLEKIEIVQLNQYGFFSGKIQF